VGCQKIVIDKGLPGDCLELQWMCSNLAQDCKEIGLGLPGDWQIIAWGLSEDCQGLGTGLTGDGQRIARGLADD